MCGNEGSKSKLHDEEFKGRFRGKLATGQFRIFHLPVLYLKTQILKYTQM